ncbi:hypothetical protein Tco_0403466 [Tanacetum coccineum]
MLPQPMALIFWNIDDNIQELFQQLQNYNQEISDTVPQIELTKFDPPSFAQPNCKISNQQAQVWTLNDLLNYMKINDANMNAMQNQINNVKNELRNEMQTSMSNQTNELKNILASFIQMNTASSSDRGISDDGPPIPPLPNVVEREPEVIKDTVQPSTENIQPPVVQTQALIDEPVVAPKPKPSIPYPSRANKQKLREKDDNLASKFVKIFRELHFELSFADALLHILKFASMTTRALIDVYGEESTLRVDDEAITFKYAQEVLGFLDSSMSGNPTPSLDPILSTSSPSLTPFEGGDFILEDLFLLEKLLNDDPSSPLPPKELHFEEIKMIKSSIDDPLEIKLKDLPSHLEYAFLEETDNYTVIMLKDLKDRR